MNKSEQIRPRTKNGSFDKSKRIEIPLNNNNNKHNPDHFEEHNESILHSNHNTSIDISTLSPYNNSKYNNHSKLSISNSHSQSHIKQQRPLSVYEYRCSLVPLPKLKKRTPPVLLFNDSSYHTDITKQPLNLTPNIIKRKAKIQIYDQYLAIPRKHKSTDLPIKVTTPLW